MRPLAAAETLGIAPVPMPFNGNARPRLCVMDVDRNGLTLRRTPRHATVAHRQRAFLSRRNLNMLQLKGGAPPAVAWRAPGAISGAALAQHYKHETCDRGAHHADHRRNSASHALPGSGVHVLRRHRGGPAATGSRRSAVAGG